jgi:hypothetical protein
MIKAFRLIDLHELLTDYNSHSLVIMKGKLKDFLEETLFLNSEWILWMKRSVTLRLKVKLPPNCFCSRTSKERESGAKQAAVGGSLLLFQPSV